MTLFGIDVSHHQGRIDWDGVATAGLSFAIVRTSYGGLFDREGARNLSWAKRRVPVAGAYHFLYQHRVVPAATQADAFVTAVGDPTGLLICLDVERDGDSFPTMFEVDQFMRRLRTHWPTHPVLLYAPSWYWTGYIGNPRAAHVGKLWHSRFVTVLASGLSPQDIYRGVPLSWWTVNHGGWDAPTILQFSSRAYVPGISGRVDANAFRGSLDDLRALTRPPAIPDTSTEGAVVEAPYTFEYPVVATIRDGATLYWHSSLQADSRNVTFDAGRTFYPELGPGQLWYGFTIAGTDIGFVSYEEEPDSNNYGRGRWVRLADVTSRERWDPCSAVEARAAQLQTDLAAANLRADNLEADLGVATAKIAAARAALG